jgi:hypothetical protein
MGIAKRRRHVLVVGLLALIGVLGLVATTTAPAGNRDPLSQVEIVPGLEEVTSGQSIGLTYTLENTTQSMFVDIRLRVPIPAGAAFETSDCPDPELIPAVNPTEFVCDWGHQLPAGETATVVVSMKTPASGATAAFSGVWSIKEGSQGGNDTFPTAADAVATLLAGDDKRKAAKFALTECSDPSAPTIVTNQAIELDNPLTTSVCAPSLPPNIVGLVAKISERDHTAGDPGTTQVSDICLPEPGSGCEPGSARFVFDGLATFTFVLNDKVYGKITKVFEDGDPVSTDTDDDPHVASIKSKGNKTTVVVKSSDNGGWDFG